MHKEKRHLTITLDASEAVEIAKACLWLLSDLATGGDER